MSRVQTAAMSADDKQFGTLKYHFVRPAGGDTVVNIKPENNTAGGLWTSFLLNTVRSGVGLVAAELWICSSGLSGSHLSRVSHYTDPVFANGTDVLESPPGDTTPGVGLAGVLWTSAGDGSHAPVWTPLSTLAKDEDLPEDLRAVELAGHFDLVCAIRMPASAARRQQRTSKEELVVAGPPSTSPSEATSQSTATHQRQQTGLLLLFARASAQTLVTHPANVAFLATTAQVGCTLVAFSASSATAAMAKGNAGRHWRKVRALVKTGFLQGAVERGRQRLESGEVKIERVRSAQLKALIKLLSHAHAWSKSYLAKLRGVKGAKAPPIKGCSSRDAWVTVMWTWVGIFLTLLGLSAFNQLALFLSDDTYFLLIGSFGALMALQFGAPNSPLAQPRNVIGGCTLAASISILCYYLGPDFANVLPKWVLVALAPATAIAACQRVNLLHPPAGAAALIFVSAPARITSLGWMYLLLPLLVGNLWCCTMAALVNNAARDRQYPVFW